MAMVDESVPSSQVNKENMNETMYIVLSDMKQITIRSEEIIKGGEQEREREGDTWK